MKKIFIVLVIIFGFTMVGCDMGMSSASPFEGVWQSDNWPWAYEFRGDTWYDCDYGGTFTYDRNTITLYYSIGATGVIPYNYEIRGNKLTMIDLRPTTSNTPRTFTKIRN